MQSNVPAAKDGKVKIRSLFMKNGGHPFDNITWEKRDAVIAGADGKEKFRQNGVEVPSWWDDNQVQVVADKYLRVVNGEKETSTKQMFSRVAGWIRAEGLKQGVFTSEDADKFEKELLYLLANGMYAFNSPVWFNVGVKEKPQCSACFIQSVDDTMESIVELAQKEVMLFKGGSGTGSNLSTLRSSYEKLSKGGKPSGPVSFMKGYDAFAGVTKSGGGTRRAAKMVVLNIDHPDILETADGQPGFITCKADAEEAAHALYSTGKYTAEFNVPGNVYDRVGYQNANNSVRVTDEFMKAVVDNGTWQTKAIKDGSVVKTYQATTLWDETAKAAWLCGDPGIQFDTATNDMHTCPNSGRINASNPCVTGDTLVATPFGPIRMIDLVEKANMGPIPVINANGEAGIAYKVWKTGHKPVYRLTTKSGYELKLTEDHKVLTLNRGDVQAKDLTKDDIVQLATSGFGETYIPGDLDFVIGLALGDGCITKGEMVITMAPGKEDAVLEQAAKIINSFKGGKHPISVELGVGTTSRIGTSSKEVIEEVKKWAVLDQGSENKRLSDAVFGLSKMNIAALLRGLFTADGTVANYGSKSQYVSLDSCSIEMLKQVQSLLLQFGIKSKLYKNRRLSNTSMLPDGRGGVKEYPVQQMHSLRVSKSGRLAFEKEIGFASKSPKALTLSTLNTQVATYSDALQDRVESLEFIGTEDVYDLTEGTTHHFVANGIVVHNCSEYLFLDDTACNLGSLNLLKFTEGAKGFKLEEFIHACEITTIAKEIIVDASSYPSAKITENSHKYRTLGLGYTNVGALLTYWGLPYDSNEGRAVMGAITAVMTGAAYKASADLARVQGPFSEYEKNKEPMLRVINKHWNAAKKLTSVMVKEWQVIVDKAFDVWKEAYELGKLYGFRNAQVTVIAPTGTISFLMGADTTGIEPMLGCVTYKKLVGEGVLILVNNVIEKSLKNLGYSQEVIPGILEYIKNKQTIHGAPGFDKKHGPVFAESLGDHALSPEAHIDMMCAVQPFISGGISKTVNMPEGATPKDVANIYMRAWKGRLKCVAIYRNNCKLSQPIGTSLTDRSGGKGTDWGQRKRLPKTRHSITHKFSIGMVEGYLIAGLYPDGSLGEIFVEIAKQGSTLMGLVDCWVQAVSIGLQHGVPFEVLREKYVDMRFEPSGITEDEEIRFAKSLPDFVFRWLDLNVINKDKKIEAENSYEESTSVEIPPKMYLDGPPCSSCGNLTQRSGSCYRCLQCGATTGCS